MKGRVAKRRDKEREMARMPSAGPMQTQEPSDWHHLPLLSQALAGIVSELKQLGHSLAPIWDAFAAVRGLMYYP